MKTNDDIFLLLMMLCDIMCRESVKRDTPNENRHGMVLWYYLYCVVSMVNATDFMYH